MTIMLIKWKGQDEECWFWKFCTKRFVNHYGHDDYEGYTSICRHFGTGIEPTNKRHAIELFAKALERKLLRKNSYIGTKTGIITKEIPLTKKDKAKILAHLI